MRPKYRIPVPIKLFELISPVHHKKLLELGFMYDQKLPVFAKAAAKMPRDKKFTDFFSFLKCFDQLFAETEVESSPLGLLAAIALPKSPLPSAPSFVVGIVEYAPVSQVKEEPASPVPPTHAHLPASPVPPMASASLPSHPPTSRFFYSPLCEDDPKFKIGDMVTPSSGGVYKVVDVDTIESVDVERRQSVSAKIIYSYKILEANARVRASMAYSASEDSLSLWREQSLSAPMMRVRGRDVPVSAPKRATKRARTSKPKPAQVPVPSYSWDGPDFIEEEECFDDEDDE